MSAFKPGEGSVRELKDSFAIFPLAILLECTEFTIILLMVRSLAQVSGCG